MSPKNILYNLTKLRPHNGPRIRILELLTAPKGSNKHGSCGRCSYGGCIGLTKRYGTLGHWLWLAYAIKDRAKEYLSWKRIYLNFTDLDYRQIEDVELDGIDTRDAPDFCDAHVVSAIYKGRPMTEDELDTLNSDSDYVYAQVEKYLY